MKRNVIIISTIKLYRGNSAGSARMMNVAKALAHAGCCVYLCSSKLDVKVDEDHMLEALPNIYVVGEEISVKRSVTYRLVKRYFCLLLMIKYLSSILSLARKFKGETVFYLYPNPAVSMDSAALLLLKWLHGYRLFCDVNELRITCLENDTSITNPIIREFRRPRYYLVEKLTKFYDGLVVISTNLEKYFARYNPTMIRIPILAESVSGNNIPPPHLNNSDMFKLCFTGMISIKKEGMDVLLAALGALKKTYPAFELHLYGPITESDKNIIFDRLIPGFDLMDNVIYHGNIPQTEIPGELRKAHLLLLTRPHNNQTHYGFSTKLAEYASSGVPVLLTNVSDNGLYFKDNINAFVVPVDEKIIMTEKIYDIICNYNNIAASISVNAIKTAEEHFEYKKYSHPLMSFLFSYRSLPKRESGT